MNETNELSIINDNEKMIQNWERTFKCESSKYMDELVMDYLISEGLSDEAEAFKQESGLEITFFNEIQCFLLMSEGLDPRGLFLSFCSFVIRRNPTYLPFLY